MSADMLSYRLQQALSSRTDSPPALEFFLHRYRECKDTHVGCRTQDPKGEYPPLRVIDVGESTSSFVHLRNTQGFTNALYTCLSYCWGKTQPLLLTKDTETMLRNGISVSTLPKTFVDAIYVTRLLGVRYLWIDSLYAYLYKFTSAWLSHSRCIFQDNQADWSHEASRMRLIYSGAICTLAATSAENGAGGLFFDRNPEALQPLRVEVLADLITQSWPGYDPDCRTPPGVYWCDVEDTWTKNVEDSPLASRAWVSQERHLSSRIIHFTKTGIFWECQRFQASENYPNGIPEWANPPGGKDRAILKRTLHRLGTRPITALPESTKGEEINLRTGIDAALDREVYYAWCQFRKSYSKCNLTVETDKLVAIQGIAEHVSRFLGDQMIAGLWRNHLLEDLCWYKYQRNDVACDPTKWIAPTWSWANTDGKTYISPTYRDHKDCTGWRSFSEIGGIDVRFKTSGELEHGVLKLRCKPLTALATPDTAKSEITFIKSQVNMDPYYQTDWKTHLIIDGSTWKERRSVLVIVLQQCRHQAAAEWSDLQSSMEGLMVALQSGSEDVYQRVGLFRIEGENNFIKISKELDTAEEAVVALV